jgi:nucleotide-binding universal stress UspA family protein
MLNILVPTDFSPLSKVAVQYATRIASKLQGNITLLHVITITETTRASRRDQMKALEQDMISAAEDDLHKLIKEIYKTAQMSSPVKCDVARGSSFQETLLKEAKRLHTGLIVMGTRGASGLKKTVLGSNTTSIIEASDVPVMAVPAKAEFKGFRDIVYASDLNHLEEELKVLIPYVEKFDSIVHLLHIAQPGCDVDALEEKIEAAEKKLGYKNMVNLVLVDRDIDGAIDQYIQVAKADLLTMFTHQLSFYEKIFDKSRTREMAFHSRVPLLAFKQGKG